MKIRKQDLILMEDPNGDYYLTKEKYFHNLSRKKQRENLFENHAVMPVIRNLADLLIRLDSRKHYLFDGNGKLIGSNEKKYLLDEIAGVREPFRAENLDNQFYLRNGIWTMHYDFRKDGSYRVKEIKVLMENGYIDLKDLDEDGMPKKVLDNGKINYYHPRNNAVARVGANSVRAVLYCDGDPEDSDWALGVRAKFLSIPEGIRK